METLAARGDVGHTYLAVKLALVAALEAAFDLGETEKVHELLAEIEALRPGERPRLLEAHRRRFRAKLSGDAAGLEAAAALFRELSVRFWLAVTLLEHGELTSDPVSLAEAREIFEELKATPWLERLDRIAPARVEVPA